MRPLTAIGVVTTLAGFVIVLEHGFAGAIDLSEIAVTLVGFLAVVQGIRYASARRNRDRTTLDPGEPERRRRATVPGADVDDLIDRVSGSAGRRHGARSRLRGRVHDVAIPAIARAHDVSHDRAVKLAETGGWTNDRTAAAFLANDAAYPVGVRLRAALLGRSPFERGLVATIAELERIDATGRLDGGQPSDATDGFATGVGEDDRGSRTTMTEDRGRR